MKSQLIDQSNRPIRRSQKAGALTNRYAPLCNPHSDPIRPQNFAFPPSSCISGPASCFVPQLTQGYASQNNIRHPALSSFSPAHTGRHGSTRFRFSTRISIQAVPTNPKYSQANPNLMHLTLTRPATFHVLLPSASPHLSDLFRPNPTIKFSQFFYA